MKDKKTFLSKTSVRKRLSVRVVLVVIRGSERLTRLSYHLLVG